MTKVFSLQLRKKIENLVAEKSKIDLEALEGQKVKAEESKAATEADLDRISVAVKLLESRCQDLAGRCRNRENFLREVSSTDFKKLEQLKVRCRGIFPDYPLLYLTFQRPLLF